MSNVFITYDLMGQKQHIDADKVEVKVGKTTWKLSVMLENLHEMIVTHHKEKVSYPFKV